jgi:rsbT antagonist protein RsbS
MEKVSIVQMKEILLVSIQTDLHDQAALAFQSNLLNQIESTSAKGVLIDLSKVDIVDSFLGRILCETAAMVRMMSAAVVLVGIQPFVAITLVELGLELRQIPTTLNVERGLQLLQEKMKQQEGTTRWKGRDREELAPQKEVSHHDSPESSGQSACLQ